MAKKSQRRPQRHERGQAGCMWGLISMFDLRKGRTNQKLLSDRRRAGRNAVGATGLPKNKLDMLTSPNENRTLGGEESTVAATDSNKPSVKKLIEEEMFSEKDLRKEMDDGGREPKQSNSEQVDHRWKNSRRTNRSRSKSCDIHLEDLTITENLRSEWPGLKNLQKRSTRSLDFDEIMEEFCRQIQQKNTDCLHDQHDEDEVTGQPNQKNPEFEEKLGEAIKLFISQKLTMWNRIKEDGDRQHSKELTDALKILCSDEEQVLKHLQGPKSVMVKYIEDLWSAEVEKNKDLKSHTESNLFEHPKEGISYKQHNFFRRKPKSSEQILLRPDVASQASNRIVILKPVPKGLQHTGGEGRFHSSPESPSMIRNKEPRVGSYFFLTELKRKLKNAMGKERQETSVGGTSKTFTNGNQVVREGKKGSKENVGRKSPSKDHFFIERIARPSKGAKKVVMANHLQECEASMECEASNDRKQRLTNLYMEAKKHLSEILSDETGNMEFPCEHIPKTLGRILSLSENSSSPVGSPRRDLGRMTEKLNLPDESQKQDSVTHLGQVAMNAESQPCIYDSNTDGRLQAPLSPNSNGLLDGNDLEKACCSVGDKMSKGGVEIVSVMEIPVHGENSTFDTVSEPSIIMDDRDGDLSKACDELRHSECLKHNSAEGIQLPASPSAYPSTSLTTEKFEEPEDASFMPERPSPVSVLEPLFPDDDISPASIKSKPTGELPMQPLRIQFKDGETSAAEQDILLETCEVDKEFEYVKAVLLASGMKWDDFHIKSYSSDQFLDPSMLDELEFFTDLLWCDKKLLFNCVNEVLMEICMQYIGCFTGLSIMKPTTRPLPDMKSAICEVWKGVQWHLLPLPLPHTLDQIVKKDMSKSGLWMDLRYDAETVIVEIGQAIFDDLMEETALAFGNRSLKSGNAFIRPALEECWRT